MREGAGRRGGGVGAVVERRGVVVVLETTWEMDGGEDGIARGTTKDLPAQTSEREAREAKHSTADGGVTAAAAAQAPKTKTDCGCSVQAVDQTACLRHVRLATIMYYLMPVYHIPPALMSSMQTRPADSNITFNRVANFFVTTFTALPLPLPPASPRPLSEPDLRRPKANPLLAAGESGSHTLVLSQQIRR
jgi:hypothetical protein